MGSAEISSGDDSGAPLSIAMVTPGWPAREFANGIVTAVVTLGDAFRARGHRVHVLAQQLIGPEEPGVYAIDATNPRRRSLIDRAVDRFFYRFLPDRAPARRVGRSVGRLLNRIAAAPGGLDIFEMEETFGWPVDVAPRCPVPMVVRLHGPWFLNGPARGEPEDDAYRRRLDRERRAIAVADAVTAPSRDVLDRTRAFYDLPLPDAEIIFYPTPPVPGHLRWRADASTPGLVVFVGRFDRHKGADTAIDAFHRLMTLAPEARFCFVGPEAGFVDDAGKNWLLADYVREKAPGLQESGRFEWRGRLEPAAIAQLRREAAVTLVASRYETMCIAALEALAHGSPLVASRAGAIPEIVREGSDCLAFDPGDAEGAAGAILRLLRDPGMAAEFGRRGAERVAREHSPDAIAGKTVAFYRRVLARKRGGR